MSGSARPTQRRKIEEIGKVTSHTKFPAAILAQSKVSPSEKQVVDCLKKKEELQVADEAKAEAARKQRSSDKEEKPVKGEKLWRLARSRGSSKALHEYNATEIEHVGVYLGIKWKEITKKKDRICHICALHPDEPLGELPADCNAAPAAN